MLFVFFGLAIVGAILFLALRIVISFFGRSATVAFDRYASMTMSFLFKASILVLAGVIIYVIVAAMQQPQP